MSRAGRSLSVGLLAFAVALPGAAGNVSTPADILAAMQKSKLTYVIGGPGAVKNPVKELDCPPRQSDMRVVVKLDGSKSLVSWEASKEAAPHFEAAEKHFAASEYAAAGEEYERGLAIDPSYGPGWLYAGDIPFARGDYAKALERYRKALALDPTLAQAHRFAGDALFKLGRLGEAEDEYVEALVDDPSYDGPIQALELLGAKAGFTILRPEFLSPPAAIGEVADGKVQISLDPATPQWVSYLLCKAVWRNEPDYRRKHLGVGESAEPYRWSLNEERDCAGAFLLGAMSAAEAKLTKEREARHQPAGAIGQAEVLAASPPLVRHIWEAAQAGLLDGFVGYAIIGRRCPVAAALLADPIRAATARYVRRFVIVRPAKAP